MRLLDLLALRRRAVADALLGAVLAVVLAAELLHLARAHRPWLPDGLVAVVVCGAALLRQRSRRWAAVAAFTVSIAAAVAARIGDLPGQPGAAATLALLVLVGSSVRVLPVRPAAAVAACGAAVALLEMSLHPDIAGLLRQGWGAALVAGLGLRLWDARRREAVERIRREERLALARELHDVAAHHLTGVVLQTQAARIAARKRPEALEGVLADIESAGTGALDAVRRVVGLLRDGGDAAGVAPGPEQLSALVGRFAGRGPAVRLRLPDGPADPSWPPEVAATVYRVVQEALTNVTRHAPQAGEVTVTLAHDQRTISVEVADDAPPIGGHWFPGSGGYGLTGMRERVRALGGSLSAGPRPVAGWSVRATLPVAGRA